MERRRLAVIMFTDMVGYSKKVHQDEETALKLLTEHNRVLEAQINAHNGNIIKTIGDSFMVDFDSAFNAVNCAVEIQKELAQINAGIAPEERMEVRIGIHVGDVIYRENDVFGDGVNIASRIEGLAGGGEIFISFDVFSITYGKLKSPFKDVGSRELKNIDRPVHVYEVLWDSARAGEATQFPFAVHRHTGGRRSSVWMAAAAVAVIAAGIAAFSFLKSPQSLDSPKPRLAVVAFSDYTGEEELRRVRIGKIISDAVVQKFYEFPHVQLVSPLRVARAKKDLGIGDGKLAEEPSLAEEIASEIEGELLISGSLRKLGDRYILTAELNHLDREELLANLRLEADSPSQLISPLVDSLCARFQGQIADAFNIEKDAPRAIVSIGELVTSSMEAYAHYVRGSELNRSGMLDQGTAELIRATEIDTSFALAYSEAACAFSFAQQDSLSNLYFQKAARYRDRFTGDSKESLLFRGNDAWYKNDLEECGRNYSRIIELYPDDREGYYYYGLYLQYLQDDNEKAIEQYDRAIVLTPDYFPVYRDKAYALKEDKGDEVAIVFLQDYLKKYGDGPGGDHARKAIAEIRGG